MRKLHESYELIQSMIKAIDHLPLPSDTSSIVYESIDEAIRSLNIVADEICDEMLNGGGDGSYLNRMFMGD